MNLYLANKELNNQSITLNFSIPIFQKGLEYIDYKSSKNQSEMFFDEYEIYKNYLSNELTKTLEDIDSALQNAKICSEIINFYTIDWDLTKSTLKEQSEETQRAINKLILE